jgi:hypothetical protein
VFIVLSAVGIESVISIVIHIYPRRAGVGADRMLSKFPQRVSGFGLGNRSKRRDLASPMIRLAAAIALPWPRSL